MGGGKKKTVVGKEKGKVRRKEGGKEVRRRKGERREAGTEGERQRGRRLESINF